MKVLWRILRFSPSRQLLAAVLRSRTGRLAPRRIVRAVGRKRILRLAWRAVRP